MDGGTTLATPASKRTTGPSGEATYNALSDINIKTPKSPRLMPGEEALFL